MAPRALLSVHDKRGIADFAKGLHNFGYELISTDKTAEELRKAGLPVVDVAAFTGSPEILEGRVKTLHPKIAGGILFKRGEAEHEMQAGAFAIDLVCVNFYPFEEAVKQKGGVETALEMIDVGGPTLVRAAAKNFEHVIAVTNPDQYPIVLQALQEKKMDENLRRQFALDAFSSVASYDVAIQHYFSKLSGSPLFPSDVFLHLMKLQDLRYGENPHQQAALYKYTDATLSFADLKQLNGKQLSYNNLVDVQAALELVHGFRNEKKAFAAVFKHANPTGAARSDSVLDAYKKAHSADVLSAYGGIAGFNCPVDKNTAEEIVKTFMEIVVAPKFEKEALAVFQSKPNLRVLEASRLLQEEDLFGHYSARDVVGGLLLQTPDKGEEVFDASKLRVVTKRKPSEKEWRALGFAWKLVKVPKSNCIVFANEDMLVASGVGQQSRVDACQIAIEKAKRAKLEVKGAVMASEAFFPFRDTVDFAALVGVTAVVQPGGSKRDAEVIAAADEHGMAMVFTGIRHFRH